MKDALTSLLRKSEIIKYLGDLELNNVAKMNKGWKIFNKLFLKFTFIAFISVVKIS
jgi:hypothetical protein